MQKAPSPNKMSATSFQSMINLHKAEDLACSQDNSMTVIHPQQVDSAVEEDVDIPEIDGVGRYVDATNSAEFKLSNRQQYNNYDIRKDLAKALLDTNLKKESFNSDDIQKIKQELNDYFTSEPVDEVYIAFVEKQRTP